MTFNKTDLYIEILMKEFPDKIEWNTISNNKYISIDFINKYFDKLNKYELLQNYNVYPIHIEKWFSVDEIKNLCYVITENPNLTDEFVRKYYLDEIYSNPNLYKFIKLTNSEFESNYNKIVNWHIFFRNYKYICNLFESLNNEWFSLNVRTDIWHHIGLNPNIKPSFIEKYDYIIDFTQIKWNSSMNKEFIDKYIYFINLDIFVAGTNIPFNLYEPYIDKISRSNYQTIKTLPLKYAFFNHNEINEQVIDSDFIEKNKKNVSWITLSQNTNLTIDMIRRHRNLYWFYLWQNSFENAPILK